MKINYSLIIPVYNKESHLPNLFTQLDKIPCKNVETIFIDDGSSDKSLALLKEYAKNHENCIVLTQKNAGPGSARNKGIAKASGQYIWFVDSDDVINTKAFEIFDALIKNAKNPDIICFDYKRTDKNSTDFNTSTFKDYSNISNKHALLFEAVSPWSKIFNKSFLSKNKIQFPSFYFGEDLNFTRQAFCTAKSIIHADVVLYNYIVDSSSISSTHYNKHSSDFIKICHNIYKLSEKYPDCQEELFYNICEHTRNFISNMKDPENFTDEIIKLNEFITKNKININTYELLETQINSKYTSSVRWRITEPLSKIKNLLSK